MNFMIILFAIVNKTTTIRELKTCITIIVFDCDNLFN